MKFEMVRIVCFQIYRHFKKYYSAICEDKDKFTIALMKEAIAAIFIYFELYFWTLLTLRKLN